MNYSSRHVPTHGRGGSSGNRPLNPLTAVDFYGPIGTSIKDFLPRDLRNGHQIFIFKPGQRDAEMYCLHVIALFQLWYRETFPPLTIDYLAETLWQFPRRTTRHMGLAVHTQVDKPMEDRRHRSGSFSLIRVKLTERGTLWEKRIEANLIPGEEVGSE